MCFCRFGSGGQDSGQRHGHGRADVFYCSAGWGIQEIAASTQPFTNTSASAFRFHFPLREWDYWNGPTPMP